MTKIKKKKLEMICWLDDDSKAHENLSMAHFFSNELGIIEDRGEWIVDCTEIHGGSYQVWRRVDNEVWTIGHFGASVPLKALSREYAFMRFFQVNRRIEFYHMNKTIEFELKRERRDQEVWREIQLEEKIADLDPIESMMDLIFLDALLGKVLPNLWLPWKN